MSRKLDLNAPKTIKVSHTSEDSDMERFMSDLTVDESAPAPKKRKLDLVGGESNTMVGKRMTDNTQKDDAGTLVIEEVEETQNDDLSGFEFDESSNDMGMEIEYKTDFGQTEDAQSTMTMESLDADSGTEPHYAESDYDSTYREEPEAIEDSVSVATNDTSSDSEGKMSFVQCLTRLFTGIIDFKGKTNRANFWKMFAWSLILSFGLSTVFGVVAIIFPPAFVGLTIAYIVPVLAMVAPSCRRFHDVGYEWWVPLASYGAGLVVMIFAVTDIVMPIIEASAAGQMATYYVGSAAMQAILGGVGLSVVYIAIGQIVNFALSIWCLVIFLKKSSSTEKKIASKVYAGLCLVYAVMYVLAISSISGAIDQAVSMADILISTGESVSID